MARLRLLSFRVRAGLAVSGVFIKFFAEQSERRSREGRREVAATLQHTEGRAATYGREGGNTRKGRRQHTEQGAATHGTVKD